MPNRQTAGFIETTEKLLDKDKLSAEEEAIL